MAALRVTYQGTRISQPTLTAEAAPMLRKTHQRLQSQIVEAARLRAPGGVTGNLRRQIRADPIVPVGALTTRGGVTSHAEYSAAVHEGARPHVIRAAPGRNLAFAWGGRMVFLKEVHHPGNKPNPFLTAAAHAVLMTDPDITPG